MEGAYVFEASVSTYKTTSRTPLLWEPPNLCMFADGKIWVSIFQSKLCYAAQSLSKGQEFQYGKLKSEEASAGSQVELIFIGHIVVTCCSI
jgi:hypothetical protein